MTTFNSSNFHLRSAATFKHAPTPSTTPDFISYSGSKYWYADGGVYRQSNHWGLVASCDWLLQGVVDSLEGCWILDSEVTGFAKWEDFSEGGNSINMEVYRKNAIAKSKEIAASMKATKKNAELIKLFASEGVVVMACDKIYPAFGMKAYNSDVVAFTLSKVGRKVIPTAF